MPVSLRSAAPLSCAVLALAALSLPAHAQVTVFTAPFTGDAIETFESFPNYNETPGLFFANPSPIFGGTASLSGNRNLIYEPGQADRSLGNNGLAQVADGTKGLTTNARNYTFTITFDGPVTQFGGYFNADRLVSVGVDDTVTFSFFNASNSLIDSETFDVNPNNTTNGALNFYGFSSTTAFTSVSITGPLVTADSLRYTAARVPPQNPVPEPGAIATGSLLGATMLFGMVRGRRRKSISKAA